MGKTALVSGISGQDGRFLSELLLSKNYEVYGIARRTATENLYNVKHLLNNPNFHISNFIKKLFLGADEGFRILFFGGNRFYFSLSYFWITGFFWFLIDYSFDF